MKRSRSRRGARTRRRQSSANGSSVVRTDSFRHSRRVFFGLGFGLVAWGMTMGDVPVAARSQESSWCFQGDAERPVEVVDRMELRAVPSFSFSNGLPGLVPIGPAVSRATMRVEVALQDLEALVTRLLSEVPITRFAQALVDALRQQVVEVPEPAGECRARRGADDPQVSEVDRARARKLARHFGFDKRSRG